MNLPDTHIVRELLFNPNAMPIPITDFNFSPDVLKVTFTDASGNDPIYWQWLFGDGTISNQQNPVHTFPSSGVYAVTLTSGNNEGQSIATKLVTIAVPASVDYLKIENYIKYKIPKEIYEYLNTTFPTLFADFTKKWQVYLSTLVVPNIRNSDIFNEAIWPPLARTLIGELVILDVLQLAGSSGLMGGGGGGGGMGFLKKIETGPSNVEWDVKLSAWGNGDGLMDFTKQLVCTIARQLGVHLPFCGYNPNNPINFRITPKPKKRTFYEYLLKQKSE